MKEMSDEEVFGAATAAPAAAPADQTGFAGRFPEAGAFAPTAPMPWSEVGRQALRNAPDSAVTMGKDIVQAVAHPFQTGANIGSVIAGGVQKAGQAAGLPGIDTSQIPAADAIGSYFADRYGGIENFKKSLAEDPIGVAGDISTLFTGGGGAAARLPGVAGRVGEIAATAGRVIDPITAAGKAVSGAGRVATELAGLPSGLVGRSLEEARVAGREGGTAGEAFREQMRGAGAMEEPVADARRAVAQMKAEKGAEYTQRMQELGKDKTILSWNDVDTAINDMNKVATFKGQTISPSTTKVRNEITGVIDDWKNLKASEFWTPEGFDALKKRVGDIRDTTQYGTPERVVADQAYNSIKNTIVKQDPTYAKIMMGYERATSLVKEIESTLSLKPGANIDTSLRKLQSVLRNNVNTNYGRREKLAEFLRDAGAPNLMAKIAGQSLNTVAPRGLMRAVAGTLPIVLSGAVNPAALALLPLLSPRLMGETFHAIGRGQKAVSDLATLGQRYPGGPRGLASLARQAGRAPYEGE